MSRVSQSLIRLRMRQIEKSQDNLLRRFIRDKDFARIMSKHPLHACLGEWLPNPENFSVLELGCGPGKYVAMLSTLGFEVYGVDPLYFPTWEIIQRETSAKLQDKVFGEDLPFADASIDHAVCLGTLLYMNDPTKALQEIKRVIRPGGHIIIRTVNKNNLFTLHTGKRLDPASKNLYALEELVMLMTEAGLIVSRKFSYGFWPPVWTDFWWYLVSVWLPVSAQDFLSNRTRPENRVNNIVFASAPLK